MSLKRISRWIIASVVYLVSIYLDLIGQSELAVLLIILLALIVITILCYEKRRKR